MKKLKLLILTVFIIAVSVKGFAGTSINFGSDISGEFPNTTMYNNFKTSLANGFKDAIKHQRNMLFSPYLLSQSFINE